MEIVKERVTVFPPVILKQLLTVTKWAEQVYGISTDRTLHWFSNQKQASIKLESKQTPCALYVDANVICIGFDNGTVEIRDRIDPNRLIIITSPKDAGGPGSSKVTHIHSTEQYLLVNTTENGLLIYDNDYEFFKWIMIGGFTTIVNFAIEENLLFVVTNDHQIHLLNFRISRLIPIEVKLYNCVDLSFENNQLFLAGDDQIRMYNIEDEFTIQWGYSVKNDKIEFITRIGSSLVIVLSSSALFLDLDGNKAETIILDPLSKAFLKKLKYRKLHSHQWIDVLLDEQGLVQLDIEGV